jgi:hypothetical protein
MSTLESRSNAPRRPIKEESTPPKRRKSEKAPDNTTGPFDEIAEKDIEGWTNSYSNETKNSRGDWPEVWKPNQVNVTFGAGMEPKREKEAPAVAPTQAKESTWSEEVSKLTAEVKRTAEEPSHRNTTEQKRFDLEDSQANTSLDHLRPRRFEDFVAEKLRQSGISKANLEDRAVISGVVTAIRSMNARELEEVGISSGSLDKISPDDRINLEQLAKTIRERKPKSLISRARSFFTRMFGRG